MQQAGTRVAWKSDLLYTNCLRSFKEVLFHRIVLLEVSSHAFLRGALTVTWVDIWTKYAKGKVLLNTWWRSICQYFWSLLILRCHKLHNPMSRSHRAVIKRLCFWMHFYLHFLCSFLSYRKWCKLGVDSSLSECASSYLFRIRIQSRVPRRPMHCTLNCRNIF